MAAASSSSVEMVSVEEVWAANQAARAAGPWKSSRATPAEAAANASSTRHPEGKGDEVELFIAWALKASPCLKRAAGS